MNLIKTKVTPIVSDWKRVLISEKFREFISSKFVILKFKIYEIPVIIEFSDKICDTCVGISNTFMEFYDIYEGDVVIIEPIEKIEIAKEVHINPVDVPLNRDDLPIVQQSVLGIPFINLDFYLVPQINKIIQLTGADRNLFLIDKDTQLIFEGVEELNLAKCRNELYLTKLQYYSLKTKYEKLKINLKRVIDEAYRMGIALGKGDINENQANKMYSELLKTVDEL